MTDKQNHMTMLISCHQYLRRIVLRLFTERYIRSLSFVTVPPLKKESSGSASVYEISATKHIAWFTFSLLFWRQLFWNKLGGQNVLSIFCSILCRQRYLVFLYQRTLNEENRIKGWRNFCQYNSTLCRSLGKPWALILNPP